MTLEQQTTSDPDRPARLTLAWLPGDHPTPCPELLTEAEAIRYLRLDTIDIKDPSATLRNYRKRGLLKGTQVSKSILYLRIELDAFLDRLTEENPR
jgi:hypothetical protein